MTLNYIIAVNENTGKYSIKTLNEYVSEYERPEMSGQFDIGEKWLKSGM